MGDRYGSKTFYDLLKEAGQLHNIKSFDYAFGRRSLRQLPLRWYDVEALY